MARAPRPLPLLPLAALLGLLMVIGLTVGPSGLGLSELVGLVRGEAPAHVWAIVVQVRLPR
ncbi:MAG: iron ABC transporter permease, partial [Myxococcota bacterium]